MAFYDLSKKARTKLVLKMEQKVTLGLKHNKMAVIKKYAPDDDFYIRKNTYLILGKFYRRHHNLRKKILKIAKTLFKSKEAKTRQTAVYLCGEIGKVKADEILGMIKKSLSDKHHSVRNAAKGALKQMGQKNPKPILIFAKKFLHHPNPIVRREIIHGIELRGRTHPQDILPLLKKVQNDQNKIVQKILIHVLGQISYKKGCLEKVVPALKKWQNKALVKKALNYILEIHRRHENFSAKSYKETKEYIKQQFNQ